MTERLVPRSTGAPALMAAVLVGGRSRRLGRDKAKEPVLGVALADRVVSVLERVAPGPFLVGKAGQENPLPGRPFLSDGTPGHSAMAGLAAALSGAQGAERVLVVACDHPFLSRALLTRLSRVPPGVTGMVPVVGGRLEPLVACWRPHLCLPAVAGRLEMGRLRLQDLLDELCPDRIEEEEVLDLDPELLSFVNVNDSEDLARARDVAEKVCRASAGRVVSSLPPDSERDAR